MYVGGERMALASALDYASQSDWVDSAGDPLWVAPAVPNGGSNEVVYLLLREQEVSAVEDPALIDIALGGPDTAARQRILQRVVRQPTTQTSETSPLQDPSLLSNLASLGLSVDPETMRLSSSALLLVSGTYSGSENQLIRVQVASVAKGVPTLVSGAMTTPTTSTRSPLPPAQTARPPSSPSSRPPSMSTISRPPARRWRSSSPRRSSLLVTPAGTSRRRPVSSGP